MHDPFSIFCSGQEKMNPTIACFLISLQFTASLCDQLTGGVCPDFTAMFVAGIDQTVDDPNVLLSDPEQTFFKEIMGFRDDEIQHAFDDAVKFFNDRYGLDFSLSQPNEQSVHVLGNATLSLFRIVENVHYLLMLNNWIQTGNTRTTCREIQFGGYLVTFKEEQLLHGSYGGVDGIPAGVGNALEYGFMKFYVCDQSPVILQFSLPTPIRRELVDGTIFINIDLYNNVLGYGKGLESISIKPDEDNPGNFRYVTRNVMTFPAN